MNHFTADPTKPRELAPVDTDISEHVTHGSWNCNLPFDKIHFIFSCVISNRCLRGLISVPRSLLLLTWETDTFLNAHNSLQELTWTLWPIPVVTQGFQRETLYYTKCIIPLLYFNLCITFKKKMKASLLICLETRDEKLPFSIPTADFQ